MIIYRYGSTTHSKFCGKTTLAIIIIWPQSPKEAKQEGPHLVSKYQDLRRFIVELTWELTGN